MNKEEWTEQNTTLLQGTEEKQHLGKPDSDEKINFQSHYSLQLLESANQCLVVHVILCLCL